MATKTTLCGICDLRHITKHALVWCSECDEGLCIECTEHHDLSKGTRSHNTVPILEYEKLPSSVLEITQYCGEHNEKYLIYCKKHECPCCRRCVIETHNDCKDIRALDDVIRGVKTSNAFYELEQMMVEMYNNIQCIREDRHRNLKRLTQERLKIENEIQLTRMNINAHLDKLQASMIKQLYEVEAKESTKIRQLLQSLEDKANEISKYHENLVSIKQHASDLQIFLTMKQMERDVEEKDKFVSTLVKCGKLNQIILSCKINNSLQSALAKIQKFGQIIKTKAPDFVVSRAQGQPANSIAPRVTSKSIDNLSYQLHRIVNTKLDNISGCTLLQDGRMVFSSCNQGCVKGFKSDGSEDFNISLSNGYADMTNILDRSTLPVGSEDEDKQCISVMDVEGRKGKNTIPLATFNSRMIRSKKAVCATFDGQRIINLTNLSLSTIFVGKLSEYAYVAIPSGKHYYYTKFGTNIVTCCDMNGTIQWEFVEESILKTPMGISVDTYENVYVAGQLSNNVVVISRDGLLYRQLLSHMDGLKNPITLHYDWLSNQLLVANQFNTAFLFSVKQLKCKDSMLHKELSV